MVSPELPVSSYDGAPVHKSISRTRREAAEDEETHAKTPDIFHGKTILVTGAASGIGRATASIFAREGVNVVAADIDAAGAEKTAEAVREANAGAEAVAVDVADQPAVEALVAAAIAAFGSIDFLFNSAGAAGRQAPFLEIDAELWRRTYALNVDGTFHAMQAVLPHMLERGAGAIVKMASMAHRRGGPGHSVHYASAKGAVVTMTMGIAREFADRGIRCLSISPGPVDTPFQAAAATSPALARRMLEDVPVKHFGTADEIGELVLFMWSDARLHDRRYGLRERWWWVEMRRITEGFETADRNEAKALLEELG